MPDYYMGEQMGSGVGQGGGPGAGKDEGEAPVSFDTSGFF